MTWQKFQLVQTVHYEVHKNRQPIQFVHTIAGKIEENKEKS